MLYRLRELLSLSIQKIFIPGNKRSLGSHLEVFDCGVELLVWADNQIALFIPELAKAFSICRFQLIY